jgi:hypothetical protein
MLIALAKYKNVVYYVNKNKKDGRYKAMLK